MTTVFIIIVILTFLCWLCGLFLVWRVPVCEKGIETAVLPECSIIIPARNEAANLPILLESLAQQTLKPDEIIVVNDQSGDDTAAVAEKMGARVLNVTDKPDGWTGKTWACWVGASNAAHDLLLFIDADTRMAPDGYERIMRTASRTGGMLTIQPYHFMTSWYESFSAVFNIMIVAGVGAFTLLGRKLKQSGGFGPCMLCSKKDYFETGGHRSAKGTVLENLSLGRIFLDAGKEVFSFGGRKTISFRMYPHGFKGLVEGWTKGIATGGSRTRPWLLLMTIFWISGGFMVFSFLPASVTAAVHWAFGAFVALYACYVVQVYWMLFRIGNFGIFTAALFPLHWLFFVYIYCRSVVSVFIVKQVRWRGRAVTVN